MASQGENLVVGLIAVALLPAIGWRIWRGVKLGQLPLYKTRIDRSAGGGKFHFLLVLHVVIFLLIAVVAADLLLGLGLKERLL
jgi:hypothetical protein